MAKNFLDYTKLTYQDIINQINGKLSTDPRFENFRESSLAKTLIEIFAGVVDLNNYYIERRAEESYLETAKLKSSVIQLAKQIGYVITRPIPAKSTISMVIKGGPPLANVVQPGNFIQLPIYSSFTFNGKKFLLKNTYKYTFTQVDAQNFQNPNYTKTITYGLPNTERNYNLYKDEDLINMADLVGINIIQGEIKYNTILGSNNPQLDQKFQIYHLDDTTISNIFGDKDYDIPLTRVALGSSPINIFESNINVYPVINEFLINRRSLIQTGELLSNFFTAKDVCLLRTSYDEKCELLFGDDNYASIGAKSGGRQNIYIQYLSTLGSKANQIGIIGSKINPNFSIYLNNGSDNITNNVSFILASNITEGADLEDINSIKILAPSIFYSLDRCVTKSDYIAQLKSLTSPINVKNAVAWGEQEEGGVINPIEKMFNIALFTCFGELYKYDSVADAWEAKDSDTSDGGEMGDAVLDEVDIFTEGSDYNYFSLVVTSAGPGVARTLQEAAIANPNSKIGEVYTFLEDKTQMTVRNSYITPVIQEYEVTGAIYVNRLVDIQETTRLIKNAFYSFINENADFKTKVFLSNLVQLVEDFDGVEYANISISPEVIDRIKFGTSTDTTFYQAAYNNQDLIDYLNEVSATTSMTLDTYTEYRTNIANKFQSAYTNIIGSTNWKTFSSAINLDSKTQVTTSWLYKTFINEIYNNVVTGTTSSIEKNFAISHYFKKTIVRIFNSLNYIIKYNIMRDGDGVKTNDIISYSLPIEIPKVTFKATILYKD